MLEELVVYLRWQFGDHTAICKRIASKDKARDFAYQFVAEHIRSSMMDRETAFKKEAQELAVQALALSDGSHESDGAALYCVVHNMHPTGRQTYTHVAVHELREKGFTPYEARQVLREIAGFSLGTLRYNLGIQEERTLPERLKGKVLPD